MSRDIHRFGFAINFTNNFDLAQGKVYGESPRLNVDEDLDHVELPVEVMALFEAKRLTEPDIWYVSYRSNITPRRENGDHRCARATRRFKAEAEAKQFAQEIIENGWSAIAGTLNPYTPKKTVSSTRILDWIAGKN